MRRSDWWTYQSWTSASFDAVQRYFAVHRPSTVIHCAAWTDVDGRATDPQRAVRMNGLGTGNLAVACATVGAEMLYISTNEVFDGTRTDRPYWEYDTPNPINPYGYSRICWGTRLVRVLPRHYIVRTAWLFAHGGKNFVHSILRAVQSGKDLRVVTDEIANPTYTNDLAKAVLQLLNTKRYGTYHLVNEGRLRAGNLPATFSIKLATPTPPSRRSPARNGNAPHVHLHTAG
ncbi:MAG UNVERIFIED_CONTAM: NAD(P)-dependent oxidoreductase [Anaerolineae bacterium]|jgi:dTDP-4-dehydrorhamnose reductase